MNKEVAIPEWIGKTSVPEDRETTLELLRVYADLVEESCPELDTISGFSESDDIFLKEACDIANKIDSNIKNIEIPETKIWIGFPETPIGRLNAKLAGVVSLLKNTLEEKKSKIIMIIDEEDWNKYIPTYMLHSDISLKIRTITDEEIRKIEHIVDEWPYPNLEERETIKKLKGTTTMDKSKGGDKTK